jgi:hypothetical protein
MDISSLSSISQKFISALSSNSSSGSGSTSEETSLLQSTDENKIGDYVVSQAVFEKYDTNGDGEISSAEEAAYVADLKAAETAETATNSNVGSLLDEQV